MYAFNPVSCLPGEVHGKPDAAAEIGDTMEGKQEVDCMWFLHGDVSTLILFVCSDSASDSTFQSG